MSRPRFSHRVEHALVVLVAAIVARVPEAAADGFGAALGWTVGSLLRIRRQVVLENLQRAFPERSPRWQRRVARATYRHFGREAVSTLRSSHMSPAQLRARCEVEGLEVVEGPIDRGQGTIGLTGHFGNWEMAAVALTSHGVPVDAVVRRQRNPLFNAYTAKVRSRQGVGIIEQRDAPRQIMKSLRERKVVALVADQNFSGDGLFVDFFGTPASTARGPGVFALRSGVPVFFAYAKRLPGAKARYTVRYSQLVFERSDDREENVRRLTQAYMASIERVVAETPEQYFWFHKRWKTRPPDRESRPRAQRGAG